MLFYMNGFTSKNYQIKSISLFTADRKQYIKFEQTCLVGKGGSMMRDHR